MDGGGRHFPGDRDVGSSRGRDCARCGTLRDSGHGDQEVEPFSMAMGSGDCCPAAGRRSFPPGLCANSECSTGSALHSGRASQCSTRWDTAHRRVGRHLEGPSSPGELRVSRPCDAVDCAVAAFEQYQRWSGPRPTHCGGRCHLPGNNDRSSDPFVAGILLALRLGPQPEVRLRIRDGPLLSGSPARNDRFDCIISPALAMASVRMDRCDGGHRVCLLPAPGVAILDADGRARWAADWPAPGQGQRLSGGRDIRTWRRPHQ